MKCLLALALAISCISISACNGSLSNIDGAELRKRAYQCVIEDDLTAAELQVCRNIQRECKKRQNAGQFDC